MVDGSAQLEARDQRAFWLAVTPPDYDDSQYELGSDWPEEITWPFHKTFSALG